jgi:hypothetical protein
MSSVVTAARRAIASALVLLVVLPALASAQGPGTVQVGKESKKTSGVLVSAEAGDVACYLTLKDDKGVEFRELADFDICEKQASLVGKRLQLKYSLENVLADECQGDPDCKKSKTVALVVAAQVVGSTPAARPAPKAAPEQTSFCTPLEDVIFACRTGAKLVSVCASKDASPKGGYVQYRFGKPDSADPLELMIPEGEPLPSKSATGGNVPYSGGGAAWLRFRNGPYAYVVYSGIGKWGPKGETIENNGLAVERGGKVISTLRCSTPLESELGPDWLEKAGIGTNDEDFDFPEPTAAGSPARKIPK